MLASSGPSWYVIVTDSFWRLYEVSYVSGRSASPAVRSWKGFPPTVRPCCFCSISDWPPSILNLCQWPFCSTKGAPPNTVTSTRWGWVTVGWRGGAHHHTNEKRTLITIWAPSRRSLQQISCIFAYFKVWTTKIAQACASCDIILMTSACDFRIIHIKLMLNCCHHPPGHVCSAIIIFIRVVDLMSGVAPVAFSPSCLGPRTPGNESDRD